MQQIFGLLTPGRRLYFGEWQYLVPLLKGEGWGRGAGLGTLTLYYHILGIGTLILGIKAWGDPDSIKQMMRWFAALMLLGTVQTLPSAIRSIAKTADPFAIRLNYVKFVFSYIGFGALVLGFAARVHRFVLPMRTLVIGFLFWNFALRTVYLADAIWLFTAVGDVWSYVTNPRFFSHYIDLPLVLVLALAMIHRERERRWFAPLVLTAIAGRCAYIVSWRLPHSALDGLRMTGLAIGIDLLDYAKVAVCAAVAWRMMHRPDTVHPTTHFCLGCGYNLTGNVSGVCPECGTPLGDTPGGPTTE